MSEGNLSKEQCLAYIKKQKKAIEALKADKAEKQVLIEDLKNQFSSLEPRLRARVEQLQAENEALSRAAPGGAGGAALWCGLGSPRPLVLPHGPDTVPISRFNDSAIRVCWYS